MFYLWHIKKWKVIFLNVPKSKEEDMSLEVYFKEKLSKLIFIEFKKEKIDELFHVKCSEDLYLPARSESLANKAKTVGEFNSIPVELFVEGIFYVLGTDSKFRYCKVFKDIIQKNDAFKNYVKRKIYDEVNKEFYEDAYILLKGLLQIERNIENYDKYFLLVETLIQKDKIFEEDAMEENENAKYIENYLYPYIFEANIYKSKGEFEKALICVHTYFEKGGEEKEEIKELKSSLEYIRNYEKGKELIYENPRDALNFLLPLVEKFNEDAILFYHIAVGYRILKEYNIAIEYLKVALALDDTLSQVVNELGINYASIGNYNKAIEYLRIAFGATRSIEICTNLVMCYLNIGDAKQAKLHFEIAEKLDPDDEIVKNLKEIVK